MNPGRPDAHDHYAARLPARTVADSRHLGWCHVRAATFVDDPSTDPFDTAPSPDALVVLVTGGHYLIKSKSGSRWHRELYGPNSVGVTAPRNVSTLRWDAVSADPLTSLHLHLSKELIADSQQDSGHPGLTLPDSLRVDEPLVVAACTALGWGLEHRAPALYADSAALVLVTHLLHSAARSRPTAQPHGLGDRVLHDVVGYLHDHLAQSVTLDDLSRVANLSRHHLLRQFKISTGMPPHRYLVLLRLERSAILLETTDALVQTVAHQCGYGSASQFGAAFSRHFGVTPLRYRAAHRR